MENKKFLAELSKSYPNRKSVTSEIINLNAILNLPKGTEHFMSDLHGEYEAFLHIRSNASGVIRRKVDLLFESSLSDTERAELATLVYYPKEKLDELRPKITDIDAWYAATLLRLLELCRSVSSKYTRSKVRRHLKRAADGYEFIIDELLNGDAGGGNKWRYYENITKTVIRLGASESFIIALAEAIKSLVIDHLHIVGDIFDRGPRADIILDELMSESSIDIQWGNHDCLWLGASAGSPVAVATVINNSITYRNLDVIEMGYGISLRPLMQFADDVYACSDISAFMPKGSSAGSSADDLRIARMHKAISIIQFKLEGETIKRNPDFEMEERLLLERIDKRRGVVNIGGREYPLRDSDLPTLDENAPYELTDGEAEVMKYLTRAFMRSERLTRHAKFLFAKGEMYTVFNRNLLFHGTIPLDSNGDFLPLAVAGGLSGRALLDYCDKAARAGYFAKEGTPERIRGGDFLWFLWCGKDSPLSGRKRIATFERLLVADESTYDEPKNDYYRVWSDRKIAEKILAEFSLGGVGSHIINGHIPVERRKGESPIKAGGKLIVIDGGLCKAYQKKTGIAGYTLIYNAEGIRISAHEAFSGKSEAIKHNKDIISDTVVFEVASDKMRVRDTDKGAEIRDKIADLMLLLAEYENGNIKEKRL